ncbi:MAG: D-2-hydroxyacid dehydrogenase [Fulvivirga sp.]
MNIFITLPLAQELRDMINNVISPLDKIWHEQDLEEDQRYNTFLKAEVVLGNISPDWVEKSQNLRWLQLNSAGINQYLDVNRSSHLPEVKITNLKKFFGVPVAETAIGGILALYRKLDELTKLQNKSTWEGPAVLRTQMNILFAKNVLVLGAGDIGMAIKQRLEAFSCHITLVRRSSAPTLENLKELFPAADIVINTLPETAETISAINAKTISFMKNSAVFVNVGRGSVIDEDALVEALQQSRIGGAVLDVTALEPIPRNSPLWTSPNILLTQHTAGGYLGEARDKVKVFIDNLQKYRSGESLRNIVDLGKGY